MVGPGQYDRDGLDLETRDILRRVKSSVIKNCSSVSIPKASRECFQSMSPMKKGKEVSMYRKGQFKKELENILSKNREAR